MPAETVMSDEMRGLRDHVEARLADLGDRVEIRFQGFEKWLERVTAAVEKQSENRERLVVLEVSMKAEAERTQRDVADIKTQVAAISATLNGMKSDSVGQTVQLAKLDMTKAGALALTTMIASGAVAFLVKKFGG